MNDSNRDQDADQDGQILVESRPKTTQPALFRVILLNDDYTPMDFVILVLKRFFRKSDPEATKVMLEVHHQGAGMAGVYPFEVAETKVYQVNEFSRTHRRPLKCIMERED